MLRNYFKIAVRNLLKHKGYSFINIAGLTTGLTVCFFIFLWVNDEIRYDRFHSGADQIHRVLWEARFGDNDWKIPLVPVPLDRTMEGEFPEVEKVTQINPGGITLEKEEDGEYVREDNFLFTDLDFFEVFSVTFISGDPNTALEDPNSVVLTEETAERYFKGENPIGKNLIQNNGRLLNVTAVVKSFPAYSHIKFDFLASIKSLDHIKDRYDHWGSAACYTYFKIKEGAGARALEAKLDRYVRENVTDKDFMQGDNYQKFPFQALTDIHLHSNLESELEANGNIAYVYLFSLVALFILILACINFINLATARSVTRAREVGIRKVLGSQRRELIIQFLAEAGFYVLIAVLGAVFLTDLLLPYFNDLTGKVLDLAFLGTPMAIIGLVGIVLLTSLLSGLLPAIVLSSFQPVKVLKGELHSVKGKAWLRQGLVVLQFSISIALIIGTLVIKNQLNFLQNRQLGFDKEHVLIIERAGALGNQYGTFIDNLSELPVVESVSNAQFLPGKGFDSTVFTPEQPANYQQTSLNYSLVGGELADVLKLKMAEGRNFSAEMATDSAACLINQTAAKKLGWDNPIGKKISMGNWDPMKVIGVVEDFHFRSLHHEVEPIIMMLGKYNLSNIAIRLKPGDVQESLATIEAKWKEFGANAPLAYSFLDQNYQKLYQSEQQMSNVFTIFSVLAIFIACLGLFGLASFLAARRTKEIGIRKILGASVSTIVGMLSKDFLQLVLVSILVASPIAWYAMNKWLENFAFRVNIEWWVFLLAGLGALLIAFLTISFQSIKAAMNNPADSLRSE